MNVKVKVNPEKIKLALLREGYSSIADFCSQAGMTSATLHNIFRSGECTYQVAHKLLDNLTLDANELIITEQ